MRTALIASLLGLSACSVVKMSRIRPDYDTTDKGRVKRLVVVTRPLPDGNQKVGELWSKIARRYANQKREFLAKKEVADTGTRATPAELCGEGIEGILWLKPTVSKVADLSEGGGDGTLLRTADVTGPAPVEHATPGFEAEVEASLLRCPDGVEIWAARAAGSWPAQDETLKETAVQYAAELGPEVAPYVPATFHLLKAVLDTLPNPVLSDADKDEKIELGD